MLNAGSPIWAIKADGCWRAMEFRAYIDTQMADALKLARLVAPAVNSEGEDDVDSPVNVAFGQFLQRRLKVFQAGEMKGRAA